MTDDQVADYEHGSAKDSFQDTVGRMEVEEVSTESIPEPTKGKSYLDSLNGGVAAPGPILH